MAPANPSSQGTVELVFSFTETSLEQLQSKPRTALHVMKKKLLIFSSKQGKHIKTMDKEHSALLLP